MLAIINTHMINRLVKEGVSNILTGIIYTVACEIGKKIIVLRLFYVHKFDEKALKNL